jgi:uncharacterized membrane protein YraQ (UPF0718 family)
MKKRIIFALIYIFLCTFAYSKEIKEEKSKKESVFKEDNNIFRNKKMEVKEIKLIVEKIIEIYKWKMEKEKKFVDAVYEEIKKIVNIKIFKEGKYE